jgi:hypothetical protein
MMTIELTGDDETKVEEFAGNLFMACLATMELANIQLGVRLGLYEALTGVGPMTAAVLAVSAGIAERYAMEWLEQQAVAGVLEVDEVTKPAGARRFALPNAHAHVLVDDDSEACMKPSAAVVPWVGKAIDIMAEEFRRGTGAAFGLFGLHDIQAAFTRPVFANHLTQTWLPALPEVQAKLTAGERVRIAEVGCGEGLAAITIARAYPNAEIDGFDSTRRPSPSPASRPLLPDLASGPDSRSATSPIRPSWATTTLSWRSKCSTTCPTPSGSCRR